MKKLLFTFHFSLFTLLAVSAQSGRVIMGPYFDNGNRLQLSQADRTAGTARSAAMGGAFTSLGADLSSMSINPAGLGMYQSSDFGVTAALSMDGVSTRPTSGSIGSGGNRTNFGLNNLGLAWNVLNQSKGLTSLTFGFAYNRAANFNARGEVRTGGESSSIAHVFAHQINQLGADFDSEYLNSIDPFLNLNIPLSYWPALLGFQTGVVGVADDGRYGWFDDAAPNDSYFGSVTRGGIYNYDFSVGANFGNKWYLGATLTASDIDYREETSYEEYYTTPGAMFTDMFFDQTTKIRGSGFAATLGAVYRPAEALRIGVAFHTPTWYSLTKSYIGNMGTFKPDEGRYFTLDTGEPLMDEITFSSPARLSAGLSGVIAQRAILAVDYEVAWYNAIDRDLYKPGHSLRAGLEVETGGIVSVRAGGTYDFDPMKTADHTADNYVADHPAPIGGWSVTGGLGFRLGANGYLDVAYVHNRTRMNKYDLYYLGDLGANPISQGREYSSHRNRDMISLTLGTRF